MSKKNLKLSITNTVKYTKFKLGLTQYTGGKSESPNKIQLTELVLYEGDTIYSGTTYFSDISSTGFGTVYDALSQLFDGDTSKKWCASWSSSPGYVFFTCSVAIAPTKIGLLTGGDTATFTNRTPKTWALYGYNESTSDWDTLYDSQEMLPAVNSTWYYFDIEQKTKTINGIAQVRNQVTTEGETKYKIASFSEA